MTFLGNIFTMESPNPDLLGVKFSFVNRFLSSLRHFLRLLECKRMTKAQISCTADLHCCFCYIDSTTPLFHKYNQQASNRLL